MVPRESNLFKRAIKNREIILVRSTVTVVGFGIIVLIQWVGRRAGLTLNGTLNLIYEYSVFIGTASFVLFPVLLAITNRMQNKRPIFYVPFGAAWWEYLVFGIVGGFFSVLTITVLAGAFFVLPVVVPIRLLFVYTFGSEATPATAIASFVVVGACSALLFSLSYLVSMQHKWGMLTAANSEDLTGSLTKIFHFSMSTLLGSPPGDISAMGACRWLALLELLVGKLLEIIVIGAGLSMLLQSIQR